MKEKIRNAKEALQRLCNACGKIAGMCDKQSADDLDALDELLDEMAHYPYESLIDKQAALNKIDDEINSIPFLSNQRITGTKCGLVRAMRIIQSMPTAAPAREKK